MNISLSPEDKLSRLMNATDVELAPIEEIEKKNNEHPEERIAHKALAREIITDLHGEESYLEAVKISESLFSGDIKSFTEKEIKDAFKGLDPFTINEDLTIVDLLVNNGICSSKREAREFINNGSITLNGEKVTDLEFVITKEKCLCSKYLVVRRGKKKYYIGVYK
jgi:tyrosyl-tRNA synthetase